MTKANEHQLLMRAKLSILVDQAFDTKGNYAYVVDRHDWATDYVWPELTFLLKDYQRTTLRQHDLSARLGNESVIRIYNINSPEKMRGTYYKSILVDEQAYKRIFPTETMNTIAAALAE